MAAAQSKYSAEATNLVAGMMRAAAVSRPHSEFDAFLYATIGEDRNGMILSVLSALVRLDVDPWQEAAKLARLPGAAATQRFISLIETLPDGLPANLDARTISAHLIELLPRRTHFNIASRETWLGIGPLTVSPPVMCAISCVIFMAVILAAQFVAGSRHTPAKLANTHAAAVSIARKPTPGQGD